MWSARVTGRDTHSAQTARRQGWCPPCWPRQASGENVGFGVLSSDSLLPISIQGLEETFVLRGAAQCPGHPHPRAVGLVGLVQVWETGGLCSWACSVDAAVSPRSWVSSASLGPRMTCRCEQANLRTESSRKEMKGSHLCQCVSTPCRAEVQLSCTALCGWRLAGASLTLVTSGQLHTTAVLLSRCWESEPGRSQNGFWRVSSLTPLSPHADRQLCSRDARER